MFISKNSNKSFFFSLVESEAIDELENLMNVTVVFPDKSLPEPTNGGFANQEEFRKFIVAKTNGRWSVELHSRPLAERMADYHDDTIADAFPLQFPFGFTGLPHDKAVKQLQARAYKHKLLARKDTILKFLTHRKPSFHGAMFNLVMNNILLKEQIFSKTRLYCNLKSSDNSSMGEKYGMMSSHNLEIAIQENRDNNLRKFSSAVEHKFLNSIHATCGSQPQSNEATMDARKTYFALSMKFGLPAIFLTVSPDDLRNFRIIVYSLSNHDLTSGNVDVNELSQEQILADLKTRSKARINHPGLCAEEYARIVHLVIKHLFNWDIEKQKSNGVGKIGRAHV